MKKIFICLVLIIFISGALPFNNVFSYVEVVLIGNPKITEDISQRSLNSPVIEDTVFDSKTADEREALPEDEQKIINNL